MEAFGSLLILFGAAFALVAGLGVLRFEDVFIRMHVATKPATLGLLLVLTGALLRAEGLAPMTKLALAIVLQFLTAPVAAHLVGRATYHVGGADDLELEVDELAPVEERRRAEEGDDGPG
jgi:multicomponent Na+:H+ antiporter subunit G